MKALNAIRQLVRDTLHRFVGHSLSPYWFKTHDLRNGADIYPIPSISIDYSRDVLGPRGNYEHHAGIGIKLYFWRWTFVLAVALMPNPKVLVEPRPGGDSVDGVVGISRK